MIDLDFVKAFIDCVTRASERSGEILHAAPGFNVSTLPEKPYFMASICYGFIDLFSTANCDREWLVYVSYTFKAGNWTQMLYHRRPIAPSIEAMNDQLVEWICGAIDSLKHESLAHDETFFRASFYVM